MAAGKSDVLVKLVLVFFISLLSFSIGTFVGKNYSDNQHRRAALEPDAKSKSRSTASADAHGEGALNEGSMSDDEISKLAEEFADEDKVETAANEAHGAKDAHGGAENHGAADGHGTADAHGSAVAAAHSASTVNAEASHGASTNSRSAAAHGVDTHAPVASVVNKSAGAPAAKDQASAPAKNLVAGKPATEPVAAKVPEKVRVPASIPKDVAQYSVGKFTVQVAAFGTEPDAKNRAEDLKNKGYSAFYVPAQVDGKTWYRVSVGLFATETEAKTYRQEFMDKTKTQNAIIKKITE